MNHPPEHQIEKVMRETAMGRMQAINHLRAREIMLRRLESERNAAIRGV